MIFRILVGAGLLALGYFVGREIGRTEPVRKELRNAREQDRAHDQHRATRASGQRGEHKRPV
ncbi:MAG: hypothetical protein ACE10E_10610 [Acidiferrobacterales bacterium]|nr:hypothetical protein [Gammaproteobacteria bacterium]